MPDRRTEKKPIMPAITADTPMATKGARVNIHVTSNPLRLKKIAAL